MIDDLLIEDEEIAVEDDALDPLEPFFAEGLITEVLGELKSGKEGTAYCCRAHPKTGVEFLAVKIYRSRHERTFKHDSIYREGRVILNKRDARAVKGRTEWGSQVRAGSWLNHEYETLEALHTAGADVPAPVRRTDRAILMEFVGDADGPAPMLQHVPLAPEDALTLFPVVLNNIELMLQCNIIHGDLSAYNILYRPGSLTIIDFPQSVDPRMNPNALQLLTRDINNVYRYFARCGINADPERFTHYLWERFLRSEL